MSSVTQTASVGAIFGTWSARQHCVVGLGGMGDESTCPQIIAIVGRNLCATRIPYDFISGSSTPTY